MRLEDELTAIVALLGYNLRLMVVRGKQEVPKEAGHQVLFTDYLAPQGACAADYAPS